MKRLLSADCVQVTLKNGWISNIKKKGRDISIDLLSNCTSGLKGTARTLC